MMASSSLRAHFVVLSELGHGKLIALDTDILVGSQISEVNPELSEYEHLFDRVAS